MNSYHLLEKRAYFGPTQTYNGPNGTSWGPAHNPYVQQNPTPSMGAEEWSSAPGLKQQEQPGILSRIGSGLWRNKGNIAGGQVGWEAGAAGGAALGSMVFPGAGTLVGAGIGALAGSWLGGKAGESADNWANKATDERTAASQPYRPPVTGPASYASNMIAQGMEENRNQPH